MNRWTSRRIAPSGTTSPAGGYGDIALVSLSYCSRQGYRWYPALFFPPSLSLLPRESDESVTLDNTARETKRGKDDKLAEQNPTFGLTDRCCIPVVALLMCRIRQFHRIVEPSRRDWRFSIPQPSVPLLYRYVVLSMAHLADGPILTVFIMSKTYTRQEAPHLDHGVFLSSSPTHRFSHDRFPRSVGWFPERGCRLLDTLIAMPTMPSTTIFPRSKTEADLCVLTGAGVSHGCGERRIGAVIDLHRTGASVRGESALVGNLSLVRHKMPYRSD